MGVERSRLASHPGSAVSGVFPHGYCVRSARGPSLRLDPGASVVTPAALRPALLAMTDEVPC